jgi:hypothetical protein
VLVYRVFPHDPDAARGEPGHALWSAAEQGFGRWDNPDRYRAMYVAASPSGAVGETFAHLSLWSRVMLVHPTIAGAHRALGVYAVDEETHPLLDLDDAGALLDRALRPTHVVIRNRPRTQQIAQSIFDEGRWSGLSWWSMHRPQWALHVLWDLRGVTVEAVEPLPGHPAVRDAARALGKQLDPDLA